MKDKKRYLNCKYLDAGMDGMLCSMDLCTTCKEFKGERCSYYTPKDKLKDKEKQNKVNEYFANILIENCKKIVEQADKEIEEMAKIMCGNDCEECAKESAKFYNQTIEEARNNHCLLKNCAKTLYEQDYRKLQTVIKETTRVVLDKVYDFGKAFYEKRSFMEKDEFIGILDKVKKLFRNVVEK